MYGNGRLDVSFLNSFSLEVNIGVYRPSDGKWFLDNTPGVNGGFSIATCGGGDNTLQAVAGDWDGN